MLKQTVRLRAAALLGLGALVLLGNTGRMSAQEKAPGRSISYGNVRLSNYRKITVSLLGGVHVVGEETLFELREKDRALHHLHADDIRIAASGSGFTGELNGNLHYTLLQLPGKARLVDGTAERALYKQGEDKPREDKPRSAVEKLANGKEATVTLFKAHTTLFREDKQVASLDADQVIANQAEDTVIGTGAVHITAEVGNRHADLTADKIAWNRRANTVEASGNVHLATTGADNQAGNITTERIKLDLKNLELEAQ